MLYGGGVQQTRREDIERASLVHSAYDVLHELEYREQRYVCGELIVDIKRKNVTKD